MVLWTFAFGLVAFLTAAQGRGGYLFQIGLQSAFWLVAVGLATLVYAAWRLLERRPALIKWPLVAASCVVAGFVITVVDLNTYVWLTEHYQPAWRSWTAIDAPRFASVLILYTWTYALNAALFWALAASENAKAHARRAAEAEAAAQRAQLAVLRLQLNPHFMFNTLNAISGLVLENDKTGAETMIARLASFLRATMNVDPNAVTSLGDEINTLEAYLDIEAARFGDRLRVTYDCPAALRRAGVPSLILQPLIENAIKFAVAPARRRVVVRIAARLDREVLHISVADDGPGGATGTTPSSGIGLANVRARLATLYGDDAGLTVRQLAPGFEATVVLPFVPMRAQVSAA